MMFFAHSRAKNIIAFLNLTLVATPRSSACARLQKLRGVARIL